MLSFHLGCKSGLMAEILTPCTWNPVTVPPGVSKEGSRGSRGGTLACGNGLPRLPGDLDHRYSTRVRSHSVAYAGFPTLMTRCPPHPPPPRASR